MSASIQRKLEQAHAHLSNGEAAAAAALCEQVLARAPRHPDALWLLGSARLIEGRTAEAAGVLERATTGAPARGAALESLGLAYLLLERFADAERVLRSAASLSGAPPS